MIIKNIFKVHYLFYLSAFITILTGFFKPFILITILIIVHELGHFLTAYYFKWNVSKIIIFPFGGLTEFKEHLNKTINSEFLILIMGPLTQMIFYILITYIFGYNELLTKCHYTLLFLNLLPIYPLDGSKLLILLLEKIFPFKISHLLNLFISLITIGFIFILFKNNLIIIIWLILLFTKVLKEFKLHNEIFNKFLLERYLYNLDFNKTHVIKNKNLNNMYRDYKHLFYYNNRYHTEKEILLEKFDFKQKLW